MDQPTEEWRPVVGYEGFYEASSLGRIRSVDRLVRRSATTMRRRRGQIIKAHGEKYLLIELSGKTYLVHRLVAAAFLGPCPPGLEVCHNDGDSQNNAVWNLRYDTHANNLKDAVMQGTHASTRKTHCARGHEFTPENTRIRKGRWNARACIECCREDCRNSYRRRKAREVVE